MAERPFKTPADDRIVGQDGRLLRVWRRFLSGIETLANRQAANVAQFGAGTPTNDQLKDKVNAILQAMTDSDQMKAG